MKTYCIIKNGLIVQALDYRDKRFKEIVSKIDLSGFTKVALSETQLDAIIAGEKLDCVNGQVIPHVPTLGELAQMLTEAKIRKIAEIDAYDNSSAVNGFFIGNMPAWVSREERNALRSRFEAEMIAGMDNTTLWYNSIPLPLPIQAAQAMLTALELYASACYDRTWQHKAAVNALETIQAVNNYDHTTGYPEKLTFNL